MEPKPILLGYWPGKRWKQARAAFDPWDRADKEICPAITTRMFDHTKRGSVVIFREEDDEESL